MSLIVFIVFCCELGGSKQFGTLSLQVYLGPLCLHRGACPFPEDTERPGHPEHGGRSIYREGVKSCFYFHCQFLGVVDTRNFKVALFWSIICEDK